MRATPVLSVAAAAALLATVAGPATAATTTATPAAGIATSTITLLGVTAGGHAISAGTVSMLSDALKQAAIARLSVVPLTVDGTPYGAQQVEAGDAPLAVPALSTSTLLPALAGLVSVSSPALSGSARNEAAGPRTSVGAADLGGLSVLGLPVKVGGSLDAGSVVSSTAGASGQKSFAVTGVELPSIADLLAALGLDLSKLPVSVLTELLTRLDLVTPVVAAADKALADVQAAVGTTVAEATAAVSTQLAAVDSATRDLAAKTAVVAPLEQAALSDTAARQAAADAVSSATATLQQRQAAAASAAAAVTAAQAEVARLAALPLVGATVKAAADAALAAAVSAAADATALVASAQAALTSATNAVASASSVADLTRAALDAARTAVSLATDTLAAANRLLDAARAALTTLTGLLQPQIAALLAAVTAVLDGTPLVSFDSLSLTTAARAVNAKTGGQSAQVAGGELSGLKVLGADVLQNVLGTTKVDVLGLTGSTLSSVNAAVATLTGTLSEVLSTVPGFPALSIPAPKIEVLTKSATTGITGGFGTAATSVKALSVTLPSISLPTALALPSAADLPAFAALPATLPTASLPTGALRANAVTDAAGNLLSTPLTLTLGTLAEQARFRAASTTAVPTTVTPGTPTATPGTSLPRTGASAGLAAFALSLLAGAAVLRRRRGVLAD